MMQVAKFFRPLALLLLLVAGGAQSQTTLIYTGAQQTYTIPAGANGIRIEALGGGGGGGGTDAPGDGGAGAPGVRASGTYMAAAGTQVYVTVGGGGGRGVTSTGAFSCTTSAGAGGLAGGTGGVAGGNGGQAGCSGYSGGGGGGGAPSVVRTVTGNNVLIVAGGGGGGQGGALNVAGRPGLTSLTATTTVTTINAGQTGLQVNDGGGGGGSGGGCPRGTVGAANPDSTTPNTTAQATGGASCRSATLVTAFAVGATGGSGGAGGVGSGVGAVGAAGSVVITPLFADLNLVKSAPNPLLQVGRNSTYTLTVTNTSTTTPTSTARILDQLPANLTYVSSAGTGWACTSPVGAGTLVTCNYSGAAIVANGGSAAVTITVTSSSTASATNFAAVDPIGGTSPPAPTSCTGLNTPSEGCAAPVTNIPTSVILGLVKSAPSPALLVGSNSAYTLTVTNSGTAATTTAQVRDQLPANMSYVSGTGTGWSCTPSGTTLVTCDYTGSIAASGGTSTITITATPTSTVTVINRAAVDPTGGTTPPTASTCTAVNTPSAGCAAPVTNTPTSVILGLVKSAPSPALLVGSNSAYTLTVTNTGTAATTTARITDQLPANMSYVSGTGTGWTCTPSGSTLVTCDYTGSIAASGGTSTITITATPTSTVTVINRAAVDPTGGTNTPTPATCTAANAPTAGCAAPVTNTPTSVILGLVKSAPSPALLVGSNSAYTLTVTNTGTAASTTARIVDQLPANLTYVSGVGAGWTCTAAAGLVTCNYSGTLTASGGTAAVVITVTPTSTASVTNFASVDPTGGTTPPTSTTCTAANAPSAGCAAPVTNIPTSVILGLVKSAPSPALLVGSNSAYTLTVTNSGTAATTTARVVDQLPANMSYVSGTGTGWTCTPSGSTLVTCDYTGSIAASGGTSAITITATPTSTVTVINRAAVDPTGGTTPPTASTCTAANTPSAGCAAPVTNTPTSVILGLVKSTPSPALLVGSNSAYTLTVTNTGTAATTTARITDQLPANLTYVSGTGTGWTCTVAAGLVTCNYSGTIAAGGGTATVAITVTPTSTASVTNRAAVDPTGGTTPPTASTCTAVNTPSAGCAAPVTNTPTSVILGLVKSAPSPALKVGSNSAYTLTVTNSGTAATTTARVVDQLPANMTYVSGTGTGWTCTPSGSTLVTCNYSGSIAAGGGTAVLTITATPTSTASVTNFASVDPTGGTTTPTPTTCTAASTPSAGCAAPVTNVPTSVILGLVKSAPSPALLVGSNSAYTLTVTNTGTAAATTARVVDQLPANMSYVSSSGTGWTCTPSGSTLVTCDYTGSIAASGGTSAITITATPTSTASVTNFASVDPTGGTTTPTPTTCTAANAPTAGCAAPVTNVPTSVILGLVKSTPSPGLLVGSNSTYTLTVTNSGTAASTTARIVDQLPANLTYVSGTGTGWTCTAAAGLVTCNYSGTITASGGTAAVVITVTPTSTAAVTNFASVDPTGGTSTPTPTTCTAANTPTAGCAAPVTSTPTSVILSLVKSTPSPALLVGSNSAYTLTVTNTGTAASTTARIVDQLPANLTYVSGMGAGWTCTAAAGLVTCNYSGTITASGGTAAVVITVTPTSTASVTNFASVDPTGGTTTPTPTTCTAANTPSAGCAAPVTSTPTSVILGLVKSAPSPALKVGSNSAYTLTVTNTGTAATTTARITDQLPAHMSYVSGTGTGWTCATSGSTLVTCNYSGSIAAGGGTAVLTITATPTSVASVTNFASVDPTGGTAPPTPTTCTAANAPTAGCAAPVTNVPTSVILGLVKSTPSPALLVGSNSAYTLTVSNTGTAAATTARVVDQLPANLTYVSGAGAGWTCAVAGGLVTCNYSGTITASGGTAAVVITVTPTSTAAVTNYASVDPTGGTTTPTPTTCTAANAPTAGCAAPVTSTPTSVVLGLVKSTPSPALQVGNNSVYTLTVTNTGTAASTTASIVDQLPANLTYVSGVGAGWTCTVAGSLVTCSYSGTLAASGGTAAVAITVTPTSTASVTNFASVDPTGGVVPPTSTTCTAANAPSAGCAAPVTSTPTSIILGLVKSTPSPGLLVGSNSAYTLTVTNTGTAASTTARIVDQLPANLTYVSGVGTGWTCTAAAGLVTCNYSGTIAASGGTATVVITVTPTNTASVTNVASVDPTGGTTPPTPTTCTAANAPSAGCAAPVISSPTSVILGLVKSTPSPALLVGSNSAYTLTVTNTGTAASTTARVVDQLPANLTYVNGVGAGWTCTAAAGLVTCNYSGSIAASGGTAAVVITVTPTSTASVTNYASVDPAGGISPPTPTTCTAANAPAAGCAAPVTSTPTSVILGLVKSDPSPALQVFSNSAYTLTVTNTGTAATATARVVDQLPASLSYVSGVGTGWTCSAASGLVTCNYSGNIAAGGGTATLVITVTSTSNAAVTNYASVDPTGGTAPPVPTTCTAANAPSAGCAAPVSNTAGRLVAGNVYNDANHNGNLDAGEAGIGGAFPLFVKLAPLSGGVCTGPATAFASVSLSTGAYSLPSVPQGSYCLIVDGNSTLSDITPGYPPGWIGTQNPTGVVQVVVGAAPPAPQNFGLYNGSKLSGNVFADNGAGGGIANNGVKAGSEPGLAGVTVNALQGASAVATTSSAGDGSYTLWVPASASGTITIIPVLPIGYTATGGSAGNTGGSYSRPSASYTAASGQIYSGVNFGMVAPNALSPNGAQTAQPGTAVFYAHTYTAGTGGQVTFTLGNVATPAIAGWSQVLYQDSNCNATLEASEPVLSTALTVTAGQTVCLIIKQLVPAGASAGAQNNITLSAAFSYTNASPAMAVNTLSATDITTVGQAGDLSLGKLVRNTTVVPAQPAATSVDAKPGDVLEYTLTATNNGTQPLSTLFVNDSTTAFTSFVSTACPGTLPAGITACVVTTQPTAGATGALKWTFTGTLAPGAQIVVSYRVKVDQ